jgi:hypothetical protein
MMTEMDTTSAPSSARHFLSAKRIFFVLGSTAFCAFLFAAVANQLRNGSLPRHGLRRAQLSVSTDSLQSWLSFNKQTSSLFGKPIEVEEVRLPRMKVMELNDPVRIELSSDDEKVIITVVDHEDPDFSESGKDEFHLKFQGGHGSFNPRDVQAALSVALRSGLRDPDEISKAVSENLNNLHKKKSINHTVSLVDSQKDKP